MVTFHAFSLNVLPSSSLSGMFIHGVIWGGFKAGANVCMFACSLLETYWFISLLPSLGNWSIWYEIFILATHVCTGNAKWRVVGQVMPLHVCLSHIYYNTDSNFPVLFFCVRSQVTILQACEYVQRMRADMRGTNLLGALSWVYQQPMQRAFPRQVFIITDGSISNVAKVLELVRRNACAGRYWHEMHKSIKYLTQRTHV